MTAIKHLQHLIPSHASQDGDGVKIQRVAGPMLNKWLDPFLMLDEMRSDDAADYIGGFPPHPHRGFETITYMIDGKMRHRDHMGNEGLIVSGGVQWMTAARGVIHSEMPEQEEGLLHGFQLWLNLPAAEKMKDSAYRDIPAEEIPLLQDEGFTLKLIAGELQIGGQKATGPISGLTTAPLIADLILDANTSLELDLPVTHRTLVYVFEGNLNQIPNRQMGVFGEGKKLLLSSAETPTRALILAGTPIREPVVQHGPFVMNSIDEIHQAMQDYQNGQLTE